MKKNVQKKVMPNIFNEDVCNYYQDEKQSQDLKEYSRALMILVEMRNQIHSEIQLLFTNSPYDSNLDTRLKNINDEINKLRKKYTENDEALKEFVDYKVEDCMMRTIKTENKDLDDNNFTDQFYKIFQST